MLCFTLIMPLSNPTNLSLAEAQKILEAFNCTTPKIINSEEEKANVRQALLLVAENSDYQMLGICAATPEEGLAALQSYTKALGYQTSVDMAGAEGAIYIKFNPKSGLSYLSSYEGDYRGVLVSCQSAYEEGINEMYGHLPLDLFS